MLQQVPHDRRAVPTAPEIMYRWTYPRNRHGTGGLIPAATIHVVLEAARMFGVELTAEDWYPRTVPDDPNEESPQGVNE